jgi:hypothetical protein
MMMTISYSAGARWYSVSNLPPAVYLATTQGKIIIFTR